MIYIYLSICKGMDFNYHFFVRNRFYYLHDDEFDEQIWANILFQ